MHQPGGNDYRNPFADEIALFDTSEGGTILEDREPLVNVYEALAMTIPGIVAHEPALKDGERLKVPQYDRPALPPWAGS